MKQAAPQPLRDDLPVKDDSRWEIEAVVLIWLVAIAVVFAFSAWLVILMNSMGG